jgi:uncharacterized double-CXXCG motif protein
MRYYIVEKDDSPAHTGHVDGRHKWMLPGIRRCPGCEATWSAGLAPYPSVDLTPVAALADFETARAEPIEEYERLRDMVRPLVPPGCILEPGTMLGPFTGRAQGRFGSLVLALPWWLLARREALEKLQGEGLRGLKGCRMEVRFRQREAPELLELEILPAGRAHPDCLPPDRKPPCARCGRLGLSLPRNLLLDAATLPSHLDLFRLEDFSTVIVCSERFHDACHRLRLTGISFQPLYTNGA